MIHTAIRGKTISAQQGFTALVIFNTLRAGLMIWPQVVNMCVQSMVGHDRIQAFLKYTEVPGRVGVTASKPGIALQIPPAIHNDLQSKSIVEGASFQWRGDTERALPTLFNVSLTVPVGCLTCIAGNCATGKSSLLRFDLLVIWPFSHAFNSAILGELPAVTKEDDTFAEHSHSVLSHSTLHTQPISYAAQKPWIRNCTLKDNILLGAPYDPERYLLASVPCPNLVTVVHKVLGGVEGMCPSHRSRNVGVWR